MKSAFPFLLAMALLAAARPAVAETLRVDDNGTQVLGSISRMKPAAPVSRGDSPWVVSGDVGVNVRLNVAPFKGRRGRIYITLPQQSGGEITATWTTRGRLMPGVLRSGQRTAVYAGLINGEVLEDTLRLNIRVDERRLPANPQLAFAFEIDLDSR